MTGSGTSANPYILSSVADLLAITGGSPSVYYKLDSDIDMSDQTSWTGVSAFSSNLDGADHTIKLPSSAEALFLNVSPATGTTMYIKNLKITGSTSYDITGTYATVYRAGLIKAYNGPGTLNITKVENQRSFSVSNYSGYGNSTITLGGIVGWHTGGVLNFTDCNNVGNMSGYQGSSVGTIYTGGILARKSATTATTFTRCCNNGGYGLSAYNSATNSYLGRIVSNKFSAVTCTNCYVLTVSNSYVADPSTGVTKLSDANAQLQSSYPMLNFTTLWQMVTPINITYPALKFVVAKTVSYEVTSSVKALKSASSRGVAVVKSASSKVQTTKCTTTTTKQKTSGITSIVARVKTYCSSIQLPTRFIKSSIKSLKTSLLESKGSTDIVTSNVKSIIVTASIESTKLTEVASYVESLKSSSTTSIAREIIVTASVGNIVSRMDNMNNLIQIVTSSVKPIKTSLSKEDSNVIISKVENIVSQTSTTKEAIRTANAKIKQFNAKAVQATTELITVTAHVSKIDTNVDLSAFLINKVFVHADVPRVVLGAKTDHTDRIPVFINSNIDIDYGLMTLKEHRKSRTVTSTVHALVSDLSREIDTNKTRVIMRSWVEGVKSSLDVKHTNRIDITVLSKVGKMQSSVIATPNLKIHEYARTYVHKIWTNNKTTKQVDRTVTAYMGRIITDRYVTVFDTRHKLMEAYVEKINSATSTTKVSSITVNSKVGNINTSADNMKNQTINVTSKVEKVLTNAKITIPPVILKFTIKERDVIINLKDRDVYFTSMTERYPSVSLIKIGGDS